METNQKMDVWTFDNKHPEVEIRCDRIGGRLIERKHDLLKHINGDFAVLRRFQEALRRWFPKGKQFDYIILDYFYGPTGWASQFADKLIGTVVPFISDYLAENGSMWFANIPAFSTAVAKHDKVLRKHYTCLGQSANCNPLFIAGDDIKELLENVAPPVCNVTAMKHLNKEHPFLMLAKKSILPPDGAVANLFSLSLPLPAVEASSSTSVPSSAVASLVVPLLSFAPPALQSPSAISTKETTGKEMTINHDGEGGAVG